MNPQKPNNLTEEKGLSMSEAQFYSNLAFQKCSEIELNLKEINNFSSTTKHSDKELTVRKGIKMPDDILKILQDKARYHALQGFLVHNINAKAKLLELAENIKYNCELEVPELVLKPTVTCEQVGEDWGWSKLSVAEFNEYLTVEATAAHLGKFIHKGGELDKLRKEIHNIPEITWFEIQKDTKHPIENKIHHTSEGLLDVHNKISEAYIKAENRVNYFKAKIKNLINDENIRLQGEYQSTMKTINLENEKLREAYKAKMDVYLEKRTQEAGEFNEKRLKEISRISKLKITVDPALQSTLDEFISKSK